MTALEIDWSFIETLEGWERRGYVPPDDDGPVASGVTIGPGVDLGQWSAEQLRRRGVPAALIDRLRPYLGKRGAAARAIAGDLVLDEIAIEQLARPIRRAILDALVSRYDRAARAAGFMRFAALPPAMQTVIASVGFQYGPALYLATPNFWRQVTTGRIADAVANLRAFGDAYQPRRDIEADHIAAILPQ